MEYGNDPSLAKIKDDYIAIKLKVWYHSNSLLYYKNSVVLFMAYFTLANKVYATAI